MDNSYRFFRKWYTEKYIEPSPQAAIVFITQYFVIYGQGGSFLVEF